MQGVPPHVAACQGLIVREDDRVVLGIGLMAALSDPAWVVRERVVETPATEKGMGQRLWTTCQGSNLQQVWASLFTQSQTASLKVAQLRMSGDQPTVRDMCGLKMSQY